MFYKSSYNIKKDGEALHFAVGYLIKTIDFIIESKKRIHKR